MAKIDYEEELKKERRLVASLVFEINYRKQQLSEMEHKFKDTTATLGGMIDDLIAKINSEDGFIAKINSMESSLRDRELLYNETVGQLMEENTELHEEVRKEKAVNFKLNYELGRKTKELEDCKSRNAKELERRSILNETEVPKVIAPCLNLVKLEKSSSEEIEALKKELEETKEALKDMESYCTDLTVKQVQTNRELQDAREESIKGLNDILNGKTTLVIKRMGEIDPKAFEIACSQKFPNEDWRESCAKLCSLWQENVKDSNWHPYKNINIRGNLQQIVDGDDTKLKELRNEYGDLVFEAVSTALMETNEYNASGRYPVSEVWNRKEERKATMKEIIEYIIKQLKSHKAKGKRKRNYYLY